MDDTFQKSIESLQEKIRELEEGLKQQKTEQAKKKLENQAYLHSLNESIKTIEVAKIAGNVEHAQHVENVGNTKRIEEIRAACWEILRNVNPKKAKELEKHLIDTKNQKQARIDELFDKIKEANSEISDDDLKKRVQSQMDADLANRVTKESKDININNAENKGPSKPSFSKMKYSELVALVKWAEMDPETTQECCEEIHRRIDVYNNYKVSHNSKNDTTINEHSIEF